MTTLLSFRKMPKYLRFISEKVGICLRNEETEGIGNNDARISCWAAWRARGEEAANAGFLESINIAKAATIARESGLNVGGKMTPVVVRKTVYHPPKMIGFFPKNPVPGRKDEGSFRLCRAFTPKKQISTVLREIALLRPRKSEEGAYLQLGLWSCNCWN